jgi:2'-hydroxyisoflavone reductase
MRVLVIGGTLFIGRTLVKALLKAGHKVTVLHRKPSHDLGRRVGNLTADRNDAKQVKAALAGHQFDAVFDNVYDWQRRTTARQVKATAEACAGDTLTRYVFMSSIAAYGEGLDHVESDPLAPDDHPREYILDKAQSERALFAMHQKSGFPAVTLRPPFIYGPENPFYREQFFWDRLRAGRPIIVPGKGESLMQFAYVKDLVRVCLAVLTNPKAVGQAFNVANARTVTQKQFVRSLARAAGRPLHMVPVPRDRIEQAGGNPMGHPMYFGEYLDMPAITQRIEKARRLLAFRPTNFDEALRETYRWYLRHYQKPELDFAFEDSLIAG